VDVVGDNGAMAVDPNGAQHTDSDAFRGARFTDANLNGVTFRSCDLSGMKVVDSWLTNVSVSGEIENFLVEGIDIAPMVRAELDRRHPERALVREMETADDHRVAWRTLEQLWAETVERARKLPDAAAYERVDGEWSLVETLRHLVFATDAWARSTIFDDPAPYHPLGLTHTSYPREAALALGIDLDGEPTLDEVLAVRTDRQAQVRRLVEALTDSELGRTCDRPPAPGYPEEPRTVGRCLRVVMNEECEHRRYATRDLAVLEER
jgi:hypothetical protein